MKAKIAEALKLLITLFVSTAFAAGLYALWSSLIFIYKFQNVELSSFLLHSGTNIGDMFVGTWVAAPLLLLAVFPYALFLKRRNGLTIKNWILPAPFIGAIYGKIPLGLEVFIREKWPIFAVCALLTACISYVLINKIRIKWSGLAIAVAVLAALSAYPSTQHYKNLRKEHRAAQQARFEASAAETKIRMEKMRLEFEAKKAAPTEAAKEAP